MRTWMAAAWLACMACSPVAVGAQAPARPAAAPAPPAPVSQPRPKPDAPPAPFFHWLRFDVGALPAARVATTEQDRPGMTTIGVQPWYGAGYALGAVSLSGDVMLAIDSVQLDLGLAGTIGPLTVMPMLGVVLQYEGDLLGPVVPQLFSVIELGPVYAEQWAQLYLGQATPDGRAHTLYARQWFTVDVLPWLGVGAQAEVAIALNAAGELGKRNVTAIPIGGRLQLGRRGGSTLGLFVGGELVADARRGPGIAARLSYVQQL